jgi:hypothetical protein
VTVTGKKEAVQKACSHIHSKYTSTVRYDVLQIAESGNVNSFAGLGIHADFRITARFIVVDKGHFLKLKRTKL